MEVNELGEITGRPLGKNFYMKNPALVSPEGTKISSEAHERIMKDQANVRSDEEYQKEIDETIEYNNNLKTVDMSYSKIKLNGNAILIRLFKHPSIRKVGTMFIPNKLVTPIQTEGGKYKTVDNPLQYIHKGVIYNISDNCTNAFREKFKVGDVIDLKMGINLTQQRTWLDVNDYYNGEFDNHFIINENMIEKGSY